MSERSLFCPTSNLFEQYWQGEVQVIQKLPKKNHLEMMGRVLQQGQHRFLIRALLHTL